MRRSMRAALRAALAVVICASPAALARGAVPVPTVIGPIAAQPAGDPSHDYTFFSPVEDLAAYGYVQEEFFLEGAARRYGQGGPGT